MRKIILLATLLCTLGVYSQDTNKIKQIDSIVNVINHSNYLIQTDTTWHDPSITGLTWVRYHTISMNGTQLKKNVTDAHVTTDDGKQIHGKSIFYFENNELIRVDDFTTEVVPKVMMYYFEGGKPIHYTVQNERSQKMAEMWLRNAKILLERYGSK